MGLVNYLHLSSLEDGVRLLHVLLLCGVHFIFLNNSECYIECFFHDSSKMLSYFSNLWIPFPRINCMNNASGRSIKQQLIVLLRWRSQGVSIVFAPIFYTTSETSCTCIGTANSTAVIFSNNKMTFSSNFHGNEMEGKYLTLVILQQFGVTVPFSFISCHVPQSPQKLRSYVCDLL
jgi:hypothetical protein